MRNTILIVLKKAIILLSFDLWRLEDYMFEPARILDLKDRFSLAPLVNL